LHAHAEPGHHHPHDDDDRTPQPAHDPSSCDTCLVYFASTGGADLPPSPDPVSRPGVACEPVRIPSQRGGVRHEMPVLPGRGPPR
jgi:hypothetical protein